jgi:hypothetical protein
VRGVKKIVCKNHPSHPSQTSPNFKKLDRNLLRVLRRPARGRQRFYEACTITGLDLNLVFLKKKLNFAKGGWVGKAFMTKNNIAPVKSLLSFLLINGYFGLILSALFLREVLRDLHVFPRDFENKVLKAVSV